MQRRLVFIPITHAELAAISGQVALTDRVAHTVTPELVSALDYRAQDTEEAEYAALVLASVTALSQCGERLVLVAEVPEKLVTLSEDAANGLCVVSEVPVSAITCWFSEDAGVEVSAAAMAARGLNLDEAWEQPAVSELIHGHQLLWNDVVEYRRQD